MGIVYPVPALNPIRILVKASKPTPKPDKHARPRPNKFGFSRRVRVFLPSNLSVNWPNGKLLFTVSVNERIWYKFGSYNIKEAKADLSSFWALRVKLELILFWALPIKYIVFQFFKNQIIKMCLLNSKRKKHCFNTYPQKHFLTLKQKYKTMYLR